MATEKTIIGYDVSSSAMTPAALCAQCADDEGDRRGTPIRDGDEWGALSAPRCVSCGVELEGLTIVRPRSSR
jgi:hypothetical protein